MSNSEQVTKDDNIFNPDTNFDDISWSTGQMPNDSAEATAVKASNIKFDEIKKRIKACAGSKKDAIEKEIDILLKGQLQTDDIGALEVLCHNLVSKLSPQGKGTLLGKKIEELDMLFLNDSHDTGTDLKYKDSAIEAIKKIRDQLKTEQTVKPENDTLTLKQDGGNSASTKEAVYCGDPNWYQGDVMRTDQACYVFLEESKEKGKPNLTKIEGMNDKEQKVWLNGETTKCLDALKKNPKDEVAQKRLNALNKNFMKGLEPSATPAEIEAFVQQFLPTTNKAMMDKIADAQKDYCEATRQLNKEKGFLKKVGKYTKNSLLAIKSGQEKGFWDKTKEFGRTALLGARGDTLRKAKKALDEVTDEADLKRMKLRNDDDPNSKSKARLRVGCNEDTKRMDFVFEYTTNGELDDCLHGIATAMNERKGIDRCMNFGSFVDQDQKSKWGMDNGIPCSYDDKPDACYEFLTTCNNLYCPNVIGPKPSVPEHEEEAARKQREEIEGKNAQKAIKDFADIGRGVPHWGSGTRNQQEVVDRYLGGNKAPGAKEAREAMLKQAIINYSELSNKKEDGNELSKDEKKSLENAKAFLTCVAASNALGLLVEKGLAKKILSGKDQELTIDESKAMGGDITKITAMIADTKGNKTKLKKQ